MPLAIGFVLSGCTGAADDEGASWVLPFDPDEANGCATVSTPFSVANPWDHAHEALDFACNPGTPVLAVADGSVTSLERVEVRGESRYRLALSVVGAAMRVEYGNLRAVTVAREDAVRAGDPIGESALGLHVAVWSQGEGRYVDPGSYLPITELGASP